MSGALVQNTRPPRSTPRRCRLSDAQRRDWIYPFVVDVACGAGHAWPATAVWFAFPKGWPGTIVYDGPQYREAAVTPSACPCCGRPPVALRRRAPGAAAAAHAMAARHQPRAIGQVHPGQLLLSDGRDVQKGGAF